MVDLQLRALLEEQGRLLLHPHPRLCLALQNSDNVSVVHLGRSTCHAISGRNPSWLIPLATFGVTSGPP